MEQLKEKLMCLVDTLETEKQVLCDLQWVKQDSLPFKGRAGVGMG